MSKETYAAQQQAQEQKQLAVATLQAISLITATTAQRALRKVAK